MKDKLIKKYIILLLFNYIFIDCQNADLDTIAYFNGSSFYVISDPQFENGSQDLRSTRGNLERIASVAEKSGLPIFVLGDLTQNGRMDEMKWYMQSRNSLGQSKQFLKNYFVELYGNHDVDVSNGFVRSLWSNCINTLRNIFGCAGASTGSGINGVYHYYLGYRKDKNHKKRLFSRQGNLTKLPSETSSLFLVVQDEIIFISLGNTPDTNEATWTCSNDLPSLSSNNLSACTDGSLNRMRNELKALYQENPNYFSKEIILLMHQGFRSTFPNKDNLPIGYKDLLHFISRYNVVLILSGHLHVDHLINISHKYNVQNIYGQDVWNLNTDDIRGRSGDQASYYKIELHYNISELYNISLARYQAIDHRLIEDRTIYLGNNSNIVTNYIK